MNKTVKIIGGVIAITLVLGGSAFAYTNTDKYKYEKSIKLGTKYLQEEKYEEAVEQFKSAASITSITSVEIDGEEVEANEYLEVATSFKEASDLCENKEYGKALQVIKNIEGTSYSDKIASSINAISEEINENLPKENEVYAKFLSNESWLDLYAEYSTAKDFIKFAPVDIGSDGVLDLLLYHEGNSGLGGLTLSVITYDKATSSITVKDMNVGHGGYQGYLSDSDTIVTYAAHMGYEMNIGYTLQDGEYKVSFRTSDDSGSKIVSDTNKAIYMIDDKEVSEEEYKSYVEDLQSKLENKEMYELNDENIKKVLQVEGEIQATDEEISELMGAKVKTEDEAIELIKKEDSDFLTKTNIERYKFCYMELSNSLVLSSYDLIKDEYYMMDAIEQGTPEEAEFTSRKYLVGKYTGTVYSLANQGGYSIYQVKDNKIVKTHQDRRLISTREWRTDGK